MATSRRMFNNEYLSPPPKLSPPPRHYSLLNTQYPLVHSPRTIFTGEYCPPCCRPVGWGGSGGSDEPPARRRGSAVRPVSGRGNVAGPWDAESRKREREETSSPVEPETMPAAKKERQ